ncbi:glycoside hydrolase family 95 protein [Paenibacillus spongiae]|uniref:Glycoside hydrolase family 95 protein n=1 Tax=Paenibacillus spongiae TaxID=2909671 RepID=A0ABY5S837_9BACL|nr:glycoside hydrolase family 95 protein [Paenibacillus spongiae]UVI28960.1 glycoside hydrolase family 95 protein [Paenibacillus spongiae]
MEKHDLIFNQPITRWDEALPLGNGLTGCLLWGNGEPLRFSLDRGDLWDLRLAPEVLDERFTYAEMIECVRRADQEGLLNRFDSIYEKYPYPTKLPAGRLELRFGQPAGSVRSRLALRDACAHVELAFAGHSLLVSSYLHAVNGLGYIRIAGETSAEGRLDIVPPDYAGMLEDASADPVFHTSLTRLGYPVAEQHEEGEVRWFYQRTNHELDYAIVIAERQIADGERLAVYAIASNRDGEEWLDEAKRKVTAELDAGFDAAFRDHLDWWKRYWGKSEVALPDEEAEKQWYLNNYLFASCSRKGAPPMPLQGVWTADEGLLPPWKGDYHHDLNTQLCYWHYLKANHLEEGESFIDFLWNLRPEAKRFAQSFFDAPGINLPSVMTLNGKAMGGWPMYSLSITNHIWVCQAFDHYWLYTGDVDFLRDKAYVYFRETAECVQRWLTEGEDGKLGLPVSSSPEIHDNRLSAWLDPVSNYDLSLLIYLFRRLQDMAGRLTLAADANRWADVLAKLPELAVNERDVLMVNPKESLTESHRHMSHMMAIYPLRVLDRRGSERDRKIADETINNLEVLGKGQWVGYSFAWAAAMYAQQGNGEAAVYHLQQMWRYTCSQNGFHLNGDYKKAGICMFHYRPFTLEGNFAAVCALQEMLLHTDGETLRAFPAVPADWAAKCIEFRDFRGEMGVFVSARMSENLLDFIELRAERGGIFRVQNDFAGERLQVRIGDKITELVCGLRRTFTIPLQAGEACRIVSL